VFYSAENLVIIMPILYYVNSKRVLATGYAARLFHAAYARSALSARGRRVGAFGKKDCQGNYLLDDPAVLFLLAYFAPKAI
jgi:hypothetical protein